MDNKLLTYGLFGLLIGGAAYLAYTLWANSGPAPLALPNPTTPVPTPSSPDPSFGVGNAITPIINLNPFGSGSGYNTYVDPTDDGGDFGVKITVPMG